MVDVPDGRRGTDAGTSTPLPPVCARTNSLRDRYTNEASRLYRVLDKRLGQVEYVAGDYSIADMAIFPWILPYERQGQNLADYPNLKRWFDAINERPGVQRGLALLKEQRVNPNMDEKAREILFGTRQLEQR